MSTSSKFLPAKTKATKEISKSRQLVKSLGMRVAAGYLRNRNYSIEAALYVLLGISARN